MSPTQETALTQAIAEARALAVDFDFPTVIRCRPWAYLEDRGAEVPGILACVNTRGPKALQVLAVFVPEVGA